MIPLLLSSNAFLARILANENAETFGPSDCGMFIFAAGVGIDGIAVVVFSSFNGTGSITGIAGFDSSIFG